LARASQPSAFIPRSLPSGDLTYNYTTPDESDVKDVAISPDGNWIAAATNTKVVYEFSSSSGSGGAISPIATISVPTNVATMAFSEAGPGGSALLAMGVGGKLSVFNVSSSFRYWNYTFAAPTGTTATVESVAISNDGTAIAAVASVPGSGSASPYYAFAYFKAGAVYLWNSSVYSTPQDVSMDVDGTRVLVGEDTSSSLAAVELFDPPTEPPTSWEPVSTIGPSYGLVSAKISGDGSSMFEISEQGFSAAEVAHPGTTTAMEPISSPSMMSVSYTGCQVLIGMGDSANYYDVSRQGASSCANASFATPIWSATFPSTIYALSLAASNPSFFVVSWGNELQWFYAYPGMYTGSGVAYRTVTTEGAIDSAALSSSGNTVAVGSAFQVGGGGEFMLATDVGVPTPGPLSVTATMIQSSPGDVSAKETISWTAPPTESFTQINVTIALDGPSGNVPTVSPVIFPSPPSVMVSGLSFSTEYTVTVTLVAFGGAARVSSTPVAFMTSGSPPIQDPFVPFEYASIALVIAAVVIGVVLALKLPKREEDRQGAQPPNSPPQAYRPPPASRPPQQGAT
jgi:WD40 repeat protein